MKTRSAVKVGILTLVAVVILILSLMWLKGRSISAGERIDIKFMDVDGLRPGASVQMMGIRIGQIEEVVPVVEKESSFVKVKFVITEPDIDIPTASEITIQQSGIIGEKFIEITPPSVKTVYLPIESKTKSILHEGSDVELLVQGNYIDVGNVKSTHLVSTDELPISIKDNITTPYAYKIGYIVDKPGIIVPEKSKPFLSLAKQEDNWRLRLTPPSNIIVKAPSLQAKYTVIEPTRLKEFLDLQLKAAVSLAETNDKINELLSNEAINDLKATVKNVKLLTVKATDTLDKATLLLDSSREDIDTMMALATDLSGKLIALSDNVNNIIGDPEFKDSFISTTKSIDSATTQISKLLADENTKETIEHINETTKNIAEISNYFNTATKDPEVKAKFDSTIDNLNTSLTKLSNSLDSVNQITESQEIKLKDIIKDTADTSKNLKKFSEKLNKRFLLIRLLF